MANETESLFVVDEAIYEATECTTCENEIPVGGIQLGVKTKSGDEDNNMTNWYHLSCFFKKYQPKSVADIDGFDFLSRKDREEIRTQVEKTADEAEGGSRSFSTSRTSFGESAWWSAGLNDSMDCTVPKTKVKSSEKRSLQSLDESFAQILNLKDQSVSKSNDGDEWDYILGLGNKSKRNSKSDSNSESESSSKSKSDFESTDSESSSDFDDADADTSINKGRKNIRRIKSVQELDHKTRRKALDEEERRKRLAQRRASHPLIYEVESLPGQKTVKKLILDYDAENEEELVSVDPRLLKKLKLHQMQGVRFMWDACFESLEQVKKGKGGGCILAHCMGLGKTLQVITLVHTLLSHPATKVQKILILCPLSTVLNWKAEFEKWLEDLDDWDKIGSRIFELTKCRRNLDREKKLKHWDKNGGVVILGYDSFRSLVSGSGKMEKQMRQQFRKFLLNPGPQLVICDEGHLLKNEKSALSKATMEIKTSRRIALTGTPLQNNLMEYYCMVQFVKPFLLGNRQEFGNRFRLPIENGQYVDSTALDVKIMKERALVLHGMLEGIVQRFDYDRVLKPLLPPKLEFVVLVGLSDIQASLYESYISNPRGKLFLEDYNNLRLIWTHPLVMKLSADRRLKTKKKEERANDSINSSFVETQQDEWWRDYTSDETLDGHTQGPKMILLFTILKECKKFGDKLLIFSQSIPTLDVIEYFLSQSDPSSCGVWHKNIDYFRLDGQTKNELRSEYCGIFNRSSNTRARLFLISTKAGGLGINLTAANRVIIFDASWNPSFDIQSIFRVCRVGQTKPCYIYRFLSQGTMEEKIYDRQVTKLSVSGRVVDDQQIGRHYTRKDIEELYEFERKPPLSESDEVLVLPNDPVMVKLLEEHKDVIVSYHEHDSLLENVAEEELTEAERKTAWEDYKKAERPQKTTRKAAAAAAAEESNA